MNIRPATIADLEHCEALDASYTTQHIWQMEERATREEISISFRRVRIPRPLEVEYPRRPDRLLDHWRQRECLLVAEEDGTTLGYLDMLVHREAWQGWIEHLLVDRAFRHRGVASTLLQGAEHWARGSELDAVVAVVQSKNDPAIQLFVGRGYRFCGFIDHYYPNGDIGMLYILDL